MENIIQQYKIPIVQDPIQGEADVYLVRHALSHFNFRALSQEMTEENYQKLKSDPEMCDPDIHPIGILQCEANAPKLENLNITRVFVSPMQRTLQTAIHMFKSHPNKEKITFIVLPLIHEVIHTSNDIPADIKLVIDKYAPHQPICQGLKFDFSKVLSFANPMLWCALTLTNMQKVSQLLKNLSESFTYEEYRDKQIQLLMEHNRFENDKEIFQRAQIFKRFLVNHLHQNQLENGEKLVVISHSKFISALTASEVIERNDKYQWHLQNYRHCQNCEIFAWQGYMKKNVEKKIISQSRGGLGNGFEVEIVLGDITSENVHAIVNAANEYLKHGGGVAGSICKQGGCLIQQESDLWVSINGTVPTGQCAVTSGGDLNCKYVIHAVGPVWSNEDPQRDVQLLHKAVINSLRKAEILRCSSMSIPAISSGIFGFPKPLCAQTFFQAIQDFYLSTDNFYLKHVRLTNFDQETTDIFQNEFNRFFEQNKNGPE